MEVNVVFIPCWGRPELLHYTLQRIRIARRADEFCYLFRLDYGFNEDLKKVIDAFPFRKAVVTADRVPYSEAKQSHNLLTGYAIAAELSDRLVVMIEEDILVSTDFFEWHLNVHDAEPTLFCSLSTKNHNRKQVPTGGLHDYYLTTDDYCSLGVAFHRDVLRTHVLKHACHAYYSTPTSYCAAIFKGSKLGRGFSEQDGLIRRIQERIGMDAPIAYPCVPRAYHCGFYGKNRPRANIKMTPNTDRLKVIGDIIFSKEQMRRYAVQPNYYEDSTPVPLEYNEALNLKRI